MRTRINSLANFVKHVDFETAINILFTQVDSNNKQSWALTMEKLGLDNEEVLQKMIFLLNKEISKCYQSEGGGHNYRRTYSHRPPSPR